MSPNKFIVVSETESNPLREYQILKFRFGILRKKCYLKFGKHAFFEKYSVYKCNGIEILI